MLATPIGSKSLFKLIYVLVILTNGLVQPERGAIVPAGGGSAVAGLPRRIPVGVDRVDYLDQTLPTLDNEDACKL